MAKINRFSAAPKDLCDTDYIIGVCEERTAPDPCAYTRVTGALKPPISPDEMADGTACYNIGYAQGWYCEFGGRVEVPTPPLGMPRENLHLFAAGILDGADNARLVPLPGNDHLKGRNSGQAEPQWVATTDPFDDIIPGHDPADDDHDIDVADPNDASNPPIKLWPMPKK